MVEFTSRSCTFFMIYHKRPELTRMSLWHMAKAIKMFNDAGHKAKGIAIGCGTCEPKTKKYAEDLGIEHLEKQNNPLGKKFSFAFTQALLKETDYICWVGSNNFHSNDYWNHCIKIMGGQKEVTFGSNRFCIVSSDPEKQDTCVFKTREKMHLCSSGQFYLNFSLSRAVNFRSIYADNQTCNFDGKINEAISRQWNQKVIKTIRSEENDCFDVKNAENIHSYESYIKKRGTTYPPHKDRKDLVEEYEEMKLLDLGYFSPSCDKIVEPGADLSELERI